VLDLDLTFQVEKSAAITNASSNEKKTHYKAWEKSNKISLMFMRMSIASNIKSALPKTEDTTKFMKFVEEHSPTVDKSLIGTLMSTLTTMKFEDSCTMHEHVIKDDKYVINNRNITKLYARDLLPLLVHKYIRS